MNKILHFTFIIINIFFGFLGWSLLYSFYNTKNIGVLLGGLTYTIAASLSITFSSWWPLIIGFIIAHFLKKLGLDPGV